MVFKRLSTARNVPESRFQLGLLHTDGSTDVNTLVVSWYTRTGNDKADWFIHIKMVGLWNVSGTSMFCSYRSWSYDIHGFIGLSNYILYSRYPGFVGHQTKPSETNEILIKYMHYFSQGQMKL